MTSPDCTVEIVQSRFWQTNTGIITAPDGQAVLIDPGVFPDELSSLARRMGERRVLTAFSTHEDWDHVLWSPDLGRDVARMAHPDVVRILNRDREQLLASLITAEDEFDVSWDHDLVGRLDAVPAETIAIDDHIRITVISTPGHTPVHTSLLLEGERILFAGDMLSDVDPPILADTPDVAAAYLESLKTLESLIQQVRVLIPGHGSACDKDEAMWRLERDRRYLDIVTKAIEHIMPTDIAARTTALLDDPRLGWNEGQNAHLSNIEAILRYR